MGEREVIVDTLYVGVNVEKMWQVSEEAEWYEWMLVLPQEGNHKERLNEIDVTQVM